MNGMEKKKRHAKLTKEELQKIAEAYEADMEESDSEGEDLEATRAADEKELEDEKADTASMETQISAREDHKDESFGRWNATTHLRETALLRGGHCTLCHRSNLHRTGIFRMLIGENVIDVRPFD